MIQMKKRPFSFPASIYQFSGKSLIGHSYLCIPEPITGSRIMQYSEWSNIELPLEINEN